MPQIDRQDLPDSLFFASLPKSVRHSFLNFLRQVFLLVLLHPTRAGSLNCSFESPYVVRFRLLHSVSLLGRGLAPAAGGRNELPRQPTGLVGGQEHCDRRDVRGLPDAAEWRQGNHLLLVIASDSNNAGRAS